MGLIYVDSCLLIYVVENHPAFADRVRALLSTVDPGRLAISDLVRMECLVGPIKHGDLALQRRYEAAFDELAPLSLPQAVFLQAAHLRARFTLKPPDALHLACAQHHHCDGLWTNDTRLNQAAHGLSHNALA